MERLDAQIRAELGRFDPGDSARGGELAAIVRAWPAAVGEENARRAWPARLGRDGTLVVHATDSVWAFQLGLLAGEILGRLGSALAEAAPAALRFVPGPVPTSPAGAVAGHVSKPPEVLPEHTAKGAEIAGSIEDKKLREIVARTAAASLARARSDRPF